jgi:HEAT repeat protein
VDDPDVLKRVALLLGKARDPRGLIPLLRAHDECPGIASSIMPLIEQYPQLRSIRFLVSALRMKWPSVKRFAARELINLDSPDMIEPLLLATKDTDPDVQRAALQALAKFSKRPEVYQRLMEIRDAKGDDTVRQHAVATLLGVDSPSIIEPLLQASRDEDVEVQLAAVEALGKYAARPEVYQRLIEILEHGDVAVREKSVQTLGEHQVKEAVESLIRFLGNPFLKFRVQEALMQIGDRRGYLAIKRFKIREKMFGKAKDKNPGPPARKGRGTAPSRHTAKKRSPHKN